MATEWLLTLVMYQGGVYTVPDIYKSKEKCEFIGSTMSAKFQNYNLNYICLPKDNTQGES